MSTYKYSSTRRGTRLCSRPSSSRLSVSSVSFRVQMEDASSTHLLLFGELYLIGVTVHGICKSTIGRGEEVSPDGFVADLRLVVGAVGECGVAHAGSLLDLALVDADGRLNVSHAGVWVQGGARVTESPGGSVGGGARTTGTDGQADVCALYIGRGKVRDKMPCSSENSCEWESV